MGVTKLDILIINKPMLTAIILSRYTDIGATRGNLNGKAFQFFIVAVVYSMNYKICSHKYQRYKIFLLPRIFDLVAFINTSEITNLKIEKLQLWKLWRY